VKKAKKGEKNFCHKKRRLLTFCHQNPKMTRKIQHNPPLKSYKMTKCQKKRFFVKFAAIKKKP